MNWLLNLLIHYNPIYIGFGGLGAWLVVNHLRKRAGGNGVAVSRGTEISTGKVITLPGVSSTQFHASNDPALDAAENDVGTSTTASAGQGQGDARYGAPIFRRAQTSDMAGWLHKLAHQDRVMLGWRVGMWAFAIIGVLGTYETGSLTGNLLVWIVVSAVAGALVLVHREGKTPYRYAAPRLFYGLLAIALLRLDHAQTDRVMHDSALNAQQAWDRDRIRTTFPERVK